MVQARSNGRATCWPCLFSAPRRLVTAPRRAFFHDTHLPPRPLFGAAIDVLKRCWLLVVFVAVGGLRGRARSTSRSLGGR